MAEWVNGLYEIAARVTPAGWTIIDLGGGRGAQSVLFPHRRYVDVDSYDLDPADARHAPARHKAANTRHVRADMHDWLALNADSLPDHTLLLASAVPEVEDYWTRLKCLDGADWAIWMPGVRAEGAGPVGARIAARARTELGGVRSFADVFRERVRLIDRATGYRGMIRR